MHAGLEGLNCKNHGFLVTSGKITLRNDPLCHLQPKSLETTKGKEQYHVALYPDMLPIVLDLEIAYLASPIHPKGMSEKLRGVNLVNIKVKVARWRASDRKKCLFW